MRKRNVEKTIAGIARDIKRSLIKRNGGTLPRSARGWLRLARECYVQTWPDFDCSPKFAGSLDRHIDLGVWIITYNPYLDQRDICKVVCHELGELFAHFDYGSLYDHAEYAGTYSGEESPGDLRHRVALRLEQICFRK
jgi:hypothetical protein